MSNWDYKPLGTLCSIKTGKKDVNEGSQNGAYPFFTCSKKVHASDSYSFDTEAILIAGNGAVGETKLYRGKFEAYQRTYVLDEFQQDLDFIYYVLRGSLMTELNKVVSGSTMPYIRKGDLERFPVPLPPLPEQKKIAHVLSTVQRAIEAQGRIIQTTIELKKALMHKLFTEGTRGEPQKQTEIGPVPESWEVIKLEHKAESFQYGTSVKCGYETPGKPVLRIPNIVGGSVDTTDLKFGNPKKNELGKLLLCSGDLLFVRTNGVKENAGRCSLFNNELGECYYASYLIRVRLDPKHLSAEFINEYSRTDAGIRFLSGRSVRTADGKFNINSGTLKTMLVPVPSLEEQKEIVQPLAVIDRKTIIAQNKKAELQDLFSTLLHQLMTVRIRVDRLNP